MSSMTGGTGRVWRSESFSEPVQVVRLIEDNDDEDDAPLAWHEREWVITSVAFLFAGVLFFLSWGSTGFLGGRVQDLLLSVPMEYLGPLVDQIKQASDPQEIPDPRSAN